MYKYYFLLTVLFFCGCTPKEEIGKIYYGYDIVCLKENTNLDLDSNFDLQTTTTCIRSECFYIKYQKSTFTFDPKILEKKLVPIESCVK